MAASAWQLYNYAKRYIGNGTITLGAGVFKMVLARSASNASTFTLSTYSQITNEISATGGYVVGGRCSDLHVWLARRTNRWFALCTS